MQEQKQTYKSKLKLPDFELSSDNENIIKVVCPSCNTTAPVEHINIQDKIAKCGGCDSVFSFGEAVATKLQTRVSNDEIPRPAGVELYEFENELEIEVKQPISILHVLISTMAGLFAFIFLLIFTKKGETFALYGMSIGSLLASFSFFQLYKGKKSRIYVLIDNENVHIQWRPKNFVKDKSYKRDSIEQVYVKTTPEGHGVFIVTNTIAGQKHQQIIGRFTSVLKAKYVEQEMENYLGIANKAVMGEVR